MAHDYVGNEIRKKTYASIKEFIDEQREIEKGAVQKKKEQWTEKNEAQIRDLKNLLKKTYRKAMLLKSKDPLSKQKWVNVRQLCKIHSPKGMQGKWKIGYSVNYKGEVQFFHRKVPDSIKLSS